MTILPKKRTKKKKRKILNGWKEQFCGSDACNYNPDFLVRKRRKEKKGNRTTNGTEQRLNAKRNGHVQRERERPVQKVIKQLTL